MQHSIDLVSYSKDFMLCSIDLVLLDRFSANSIDLVSLDRFHANSTDFMPFDKFGANSTDLVLNQRKVIYRLIFISDGFSRKIPKFFC